VRDGYFEICFLTKVGKASEYEPIGSNAVLAFSGHVFDNEEVSLKIVISDRRSVVMEGLYYIFLSPSARTVNSQGVPTIVARRFNDCTSLCSIMHVLEFAFFFAFCLVYQVCQVENQARHLRTRHRTSRDVLF